jgi:DNA-directed RNA polymerase specialized sigma24 family protein
LTIQERQLIKWRYVDGKRSSEISQKINEHPNTVREHLTKIRDKLIDLLEESDPDLAKSLNVDKHKKKRKTK